MHNEIESVSRCGEGEAWPHVGGGGVQSRPANGNHCQEIVCIFTETTVDYCVVGVVCANLLPLPNDPAPCECPHRQFKCKGGRGN